MQSVGANLMRYVYNVLCVALYWQSTYPPTPLYQQSGCTIRITHEEKDFWHALYEIVRMQCAVKYPDYKYRSVRDKQARREWYDDGRGVKRSHKNGKRMQYGYADYVSVSG